MNADPGTPSGWRPDPTFWSVHLLLPLAAALGVLAVVESTGIDLWLADRWYSAEGGNWALMNHWLTYDIIHHYGKQSLIASGLCLILLLALSYRHAPLRTWRRPLAYLVTSMIVLPAIIAQSKQYSPVHCPWDLERYGGGVVYQHTFSYSLRAADMGHCFPAGHASGGFALLAVYFAAYLYAPRRPLFLLPGLTVGWIFALGQQARGAHFLSHDLWSLSLCWFGALALFLLFRPHRWPAPASLVDYRAE